MRSNELRALRRLPAASMLPAGSRRAPPEAAARVPTAVSMLELQKEQLHDLFF